MDAKTLKALKGSIEKWERIVAGTGVDMAGENCPLCKMFAEPNGECNGCPVMDKTGISQCRGTPYYDHRKAVFLLEAAAASRYAKAMLKFLESLLPKRGKR